MDTTPTPQASPRRREVVTATAVTLLVFLLCAPGSMSLMMFFLGFGTRDVSEPPAVVVLLLLSLFLPAGVVTVVVMSVKRSAAVMRAQRWVIALTVVSVVVSLLYHLYVLQQYANDPVIALYLLPVPLAAGLIPAALGIWLVQWRRQTRSA